MALPPTCCRSTSLWLPPDQVQAGVDDALLLQVRTPGQHVSWFELLQCRISMLKDVCTETGRRSSAAAPDRADPELFSMLMRDLQPICPLHGRRGHSTAAGCVDDHQKYAALLDWYKSPITVDEANGLRVCSRLLSSSVAFMTRPLRSCSRHLHQVSRSRQGGLVPAEVMRC